MITKVRHILRYGTHTCTLMLDLLVWVSQYYNIVKKLKLQALANTYLVINYIIIHVCTLL
jgi:hypothetical protein